MFGRSLFCFRNEGNARIKVTKISNIASGSAYIEHELPHVPSTYLVEYYALTIARDRDILLSGGLKR